MLDKKDRKLPDDREIIWEIPKLKNVVFIYKLQSSLLDMVRYIGITNNPKTRLSHHITEKDLNYKNSWIKSVKTSGGKIQMIIFDYHHDLEGALLKEEKYIKKYENLTNLCLTPTQSNTKPCYLYDLKDEKTISFISVSSAALFVNIEPSSFIGVLLIKGRYLFSFSKNFNSIIEKSHIIKLKNGTTERLAMSYQHAIWIIGCSRSMINFCLLKKRKQVKGWVLCKKNEKFPEYSYRTNKKIKCLTDGKTFISILEAATYYNIDASCIVKCCKKTRKMTNNKSFEYL